MALEVSILVVNRNSRDLTLACLEAVRRETRKASYELIVAEAGEKTVLAGPYTIAGTAGDVVDLIVLDTVDPAMLDVLFLSGGPGT